MKKIAGEGRKRQIIQRKEAFLKEKNKALKPVPKIGDILASRKKTAGTNFLIIIFLIISAIIMKSVTDYRSLPAAAESATGTQINISEYIQDISTSSYYAWRGNVILSGEISADKFVSSTLVGYMDNSLTPIFSVQKSDMILSAGIYSFKAMFDSQKYSKGFHKIRIYDGQVTAIPSLQKQPVWEFDAYIENEIRGRTLANSNLRSEPDHTKNNVITLIPQGAEVIINGEVKGISGTVTIDGKQITTDIWYNIRYTTSSGIKYEGFVLSALISVFSDSIISMEVKAPGTVIEEFSPAKYSYDLNLPNTSSYLEISNIVRSSKKDVILVKVNGTNVNPPYLNLNLKTGDNKVEIIYTADPSSTASNRTYSFNIWRIAESVEAEFQAQLAKFPESYRQMLLALHSKYPNWLFVAHNLNLEWNEVVSGQDVGTVSLIYKNLPREYYKNIKEDAPADAAFTEFINETPRDGTSFYTASKAAVEFYLDPRNFLNESRVFQFEQLTYSSAMHTLEGLQRIFANSGHAGKESMFLKAGQESNVSPYHLASRSRLELGNPLSILALGGTYTINGNVYSGLYNFYNIGTGSGTPEQILERGFKYARGDFSSDTTKAFLNMPWNTEQKAITGGAKFLGNNYINRGQDTLYYQKFNPNAPGTHQYMQNVQAPYHESLSIFNAYKNINALSANIIFKIPVYKNMPELATPKPDDSNKLNTLSVTSWNMTPSFNPDLNGLYNVSVPYNTDKITINATTLNSKAFISGTGQKNVNVGDNNFTITVTPSNGLKREYKIRVTRLPPDESNDNTLSFLSVEGFELNKQFKAEDTGPYIAYVPLETQNAVIKATANSPLSKISGDGEKILNPGINDYSVTVTAEDATIRIYRIRIIRISNEEKSDAKLKSLEVGGFSIQPEFSEDNFGTYKLTVPSETTSINISGQAKSQFASVIGTGQKNLGLGLNNVNISVTAIDGTKLNYLLEITREIPVIPTDNYVFASNTVSGINLSTTVKDMKETLKTPMINYKFFDSSKKVLQDNQLIGTGIVMEVFIDGKRESEYKTLVYGDLNGDGKVNSTDVALLRAHILRINQLKGEFLAAADVNGDGRVNSTDVALLRAHILRINQLKQKF